MNKTKYFVFITVTIAIVLFILADWEISAHAIGVMDPIPTPTNMPVEPVGIPLGEVPSIEEQEQLKAIVQAYVDIRYASLSASDMDLKQNGFGSLISETPKAKAFLSEEIGKLAVEIKHAQLNHLRYTNYEVFLDFHSITVDPVTQIATILVGEGNEVVYEISAELNPENPIISRTAGIEHTIVLHKVQEQWKIVSDTYNDNLWKMLRQSGTSTDEILRATDEILLTMKAAPRPVANDAETAPVYNMPDDPSSHPYDRAGAVAYALEHWSHDAGLYNPDYFKFPATDCQNFVSQALYEGGNVTMYINPQDLSSGGAGWYYLNYDQPGIQQGTNKVGGGWIDVNLFYTRVTDPGEAWSEVFNSGPEGIDITLPENYQVPAGLMLGDVIQYDLGKNGSWDHAAIVVAFEGGTPYVAAHTTDHYKVPYTLQPNTNYRFIHIERSNGYPPVKAKIETTTTNGISSSDDAGTKPECNFALNHPEAYFGLCTNGTTIASGFQFRNIEIPQGAQIKYAYIIFTVDGAYTNALDVQIYGENTANPLTFSTGSQPGNRTNLTASTTWEIRDRWDLGFRRATPNLAGIIDTIISLGGWDYGKSLSFIFKDPISPNTNPPRRVIAYERAHVDPKLSPAKFVAAYSFDEANPPTAPMVYSVTRASANPTGAASVDFTVTFSQPVTGVDASDFNLTISGVSGALVSGVTGSGSSYTVTVSTGSGSGSLRLNVLDNNTIINVNNAPLNGGFTSGEAYTIDKVAPFVQSVTRASANPTSSSSINFTVTFSELVTGVDAADFTLTGSVRHGATLGEVTGSGSSYTVSVNTGPNNASVRLDVLDNDSIVDEASNPLNGGFTSGETYTIDKTGPYVQSIIRASDNPTYATYVDFIVTFPEPVLGVDLDDFTLITTGSISGATVNSISLEKDGSSYLVTVNTGQGAGTIRMDVLSNASITDFLLNPLERFFASGQTYTVRPKTK